MKFYLNSKQDINGSYWGEKKITKITENNVCFWTSDFYLFPKEKVILLVGISKTFSDNFKQASNAK
jgi:hypothetical protein